MYKPFEEPLMIIDLPKALTPVFQQHIPKPGYLRIWPDEDEDVPLVHSKYGLVPKGSVLSYQQPLPANQPSDSDPELAPPDFNLPELPSLHTVLLEKQQLFYDSLAVTTNQFLDYEQQTRDQSSNKDWHRLRKYRLTASNFKHVCSRRKDHENRLLKQANRLLKGKSIQTAAMKYGIDHEDEAAQYYASQLGKKITLKFAMQLQCFLLMEI